MSENLTVLPDGYSYTAIATCRFCGMTPPHDVERCPRVHSVDWYENGIIKRVEFVT